MNAPAILLILELIQRTVKLAPEIVKLIDKANSGEDVTKEDIDQAEQLVNNAVSDWDSACQEDHE